VKHLENSEYLSFKKIYVSLYIIGRCIVVKRHQLFFKMLTHFCDSNSVQGVVCFTNCNDFLNYV